MGMRPLTIQSLLKRWYPWIFLVSPTYLIYSQAFQLCSTGQKNFNLLYESLTSWEAHELLLERVNTDQKFYKSLKRLDEGDGDEDEDQDSDGDDSGNGETVCYDEIDISKTIHEAIRDVVKQVPADHLVDIYGDKEDRLSDKSDADEGRGMGTNLDKYTGYEFSTCDAVERWMEWNSK